MIGPLAGHPVIQLDVDEPLASIEPMAAAGYPLLMAGRFGDGGEFAYVDTTAAAGVIVEALRLPLALRR